MVRSGVEESRHRVDVAVCDQDGRLIARAGDAGRLVFARSCMKPLQAAVSLAAIGDESLSQRQVAIMCSSHNAESVHVAAVRSLLKRARLSVAALRCPPGWPLDEQTMARSHSRARILHNCSGKHSGMLLACVRSGWDPSSYQRAGHPLQRRVRKAVLGATGLTSVGIGVDGCGVPVHSMPLASMATLYARLARPDRLGDLAQPVDRAVSAMFQEPYMVGGDERLDTAIMSATRDVLVKEGAEALVCASVTPSGLGIAVKVSDGGERAAGPALISVLSQLGALEERHLRALRSFAEPPVLAGGRPVGHLIVEVPLTRSR